ncbi:MAG: NADPH:quinone reductase [Acidimicrobiales bacterium]|nr:NADPH:quinone reductase [Acidimicrobiales bacterium]
MSRAVRFDEYGGTEVLHVVEVEDPVPGLGEVRVRVRAAGINPGEAKIREGLLRDRWPSTFPSGQGSDLAGIVDLVGEPAEPAEPAGAVEQLGRWSAGDEVIGFTDDRASQAELVVVPAGHLTARPSTVPWEVAGSLFVVGATAYAAVRSVGLSAGDTVVVSAAAGGVGSLVVQLAAAAGARVIGLASPSNHDWLRAHGIVPVDYGAGALERIRQIAPTGVDAFIDLHGEGYVELALELGVAPDRIDTIVDFAAVVRHGVKAEGNAAGSSASVLAELAARIAAGELEVPVARTYALDDVRSAYEDLERGHTHGKIVLVPRPETDLT